MNFKINLYSDNYSNSLTIEVVLSQKYTENLANIKKIRKKMELLNLQ